MCLIKHEAKMERPTREIDKFTIVAVDFNILLPVIDRTYEKKISTGIGDLNNTINKID